MCKEERFEFEGYGVPSLKRSSSSQRATKLLFVDVEAVLPILNEVPKLDRFEYEVARRSHGWESLGSFDVRSGWRERLGQICVGFDHAFVFAFAGDQERAEALVRAMWLYMPGARATWWTLSDRGYVRDMDSFIDGFSGCVASMRRSGHQVNEVTAYLNQGLHETVDLRIEIARRDPSFNMHVHQVHPLLGLLSKRLPMPEEFEALDDWLESKAPLPGTIRPEDHD